MWNLLKRKFLINEYLINIAEIKMIFFKLKKELSIKSVEIDKGHYFN